MSKVETKAVAGNGKSITQRDDILEAIPLTKIHVNLDSNTLCNQITGNKSNFFQMTNN